MNEGRDKFLFMAVGGIIVMIVLASLYFIPVSSEDYDYSFETSMQGWNVHGKDLTNPQVNWSIERTTKNYKEGDYSLEFYMNNVNDAAKIWIQRAFEVDTNKRHSVEVEYHLATSDFGSVNLFKIITGVSSTAPSRTGNLNFQGDTGTGKQQDVGYEWLKKSYDFEVESSNSGEIYVSIGIWGTWETARYYYLDDIRVTISRTII